MHQMYICFFEDFSKCFFEMNYLSLIFVPQKRFIFDFRKMGQIICGMDEVLGKLQDENCAQAGLRADLGKTANCMDVSI